MLHVFQQFYIFIDHKEMIFRKETKKDDKVFYSFGNTFRQTNIVFKRSQPHSDMEINCLPQFKSSQINKQSHQPNNHDSGGEKITEHSCTNFMKNYIDKLKKQRKRQNKKHQSLKTSKQTSQGFFNDNLPLYSMSKPNQILVLERINQNGQKSFINTISVVNEDLYDVNGNIPQSKKEKRLKTPETSFLNREKISQIIKEIKNSKKKNSAVEQLAELDSLEQTKELLKVNLPKLQKSSRPNTRKEVQKNKDPHALNMKELQPWKEENHYGQFSIEEYEQK